MSIFRKHNHFWIFEERLKMVIFLKILIFFINTSIFWKFTNNFWKHEQSLWTNFDNRNNFSNSEQYLKTHFFETQIFLFYKLFRNEKKIEKKWRAENKKGNETRIKLIKERKIKIKNKNWTWTGSWNWNVVYAATAKWICPLWHLSLAALCIFLINWCSERQIGFIGQILWWHKGLGLYTDS